MAKGGPTARSQRCKATHKAKEKIISTSPPSSNDVLPLLISISEKPITQAEGAQRAFQPYECSISLFFMLQVLVLIPMIYCK